MSEIVSNGQAPTHGSAFGGGCTRLWNKVGGRPKVADSFGFHSRFHLRKRKPAGLQGRPKCQDLQPLGNPAFIGSRLGGWPSQVKLARWGGALLALIYFVRGTILPWLLPVPAVVWMLVTALCLSLIVGSFIVDGGRWRWTWIMVLVAFAAGTCQAEQPAAAGLRWLGLALLLLAVGPLVLSPLAVAVRSALWRFSRNGIIALTGIFILWYVLHLPSFGVGFSAFMYQCMLLAPIVGIGIVIALARAIHGRSWLWGLFAILGVIPLLASSSRVAALATIAGTCFLLLRRKPIVGLGVLFLCAVVIYGFMSRGRNLEASTDSLTGAMAHKGNLNSRAGLWESRMLEFKSSPIIGIGIGMGSSAAVGKEENGPIRVEPGSSYLAVLSMTGVLGTIAFCWALGPLLFQFVLSRQEGGVDKDILSVVGIYLAVHGVAEGWSLAFGSPLCFLFWLWLGNVGDAAPQPFRSKVKRNLRSTHAFGPSKTALRIG